ncbi:MAG TPA: DAK2 domain-containing protein [Solirubrobacteraceae bacterium]
MADPSLVRFRSVVQRSLAELEARRDEVNDLNVFPVADGDTGDNMVLTLQACLAELDRLASIENRSIDEIGRDEIVDSVARASLLGARGNSGVILSQLIRGAAEELISRPGEHIDPVLIGAAMARAAQRAYDSVRAPAEGTILTVMREMAASIATEIAHLPRPAVEELLDEQTQNALIADVLEKALEAGEAAVKRGPELLPVLKEAGVVDAGGHAVTILFAGVLAVLREGDAPDVEHFAPAAVPTHPQHESSTYRYCTNFAVTGSGLDPQAWVAPLEALGDSVLVVGDAHTLKIHVHTDDPEQAMALFASTGEVSHTDVADMHEQVAERDERLAAPRQRCGALAVVAGDGVRELFASLGVTPLDGGPTLNPSTADLLSGIHAVPAEEVVVLPNSPNVFMAAERAAELSDKSVVVVASRSMQAGLAASVALIPDRAVAENGAAMERAIEVVRTGGVAPAARADPNGRFAVGDAVGYVDDQLVAWGEPRATLAAVVGALADGAELLTLITGEGAPLSDDEVRSLVNGDVELELSAGGQPSWWWLVSAE